MPGTGCWEWQGFCDAKGYGRIQVRQDAKKTHRVSWEIANGRELRPGEQVLHRCDNPPCFNPAHLFVGTSVDNVRDMDRKNRRGATRGEKCPWAKLTEADVRSIRASDEPVRRLAGRFGVSISLVYQVRAGTIWKESHAHAV